MPYTVERVKDDSVIVITLTDHNPAEEVPLIHAETVKITADMVGTVYRIVDFRASGMDFATVIYALREGTKKRAGGVTDERFVSAYVIGEDKMAKFLTDNLHLKQFADRRVSVYATLEQAFDFVRKQQSA